MSSGEKKGWSDLKNLLPEDVCRVTGAEFDKTSDSYTLKSFGTDIHALLKDDVFTGDSPLSDIILQRLEYFSRLSTIWYLAGFKDIPQSGEFIKPVNLKGGELFFRGAHELPLDKLAERYSSDPEAFIKKGMELGGEKLDYGDTSIRLHPMPKFPVVLILWKADEEFPARFDLLLDSSCGLQLPIDIIWSICMLSLLIMI